MLIFCKHWIPRNGYPKTIPFPKIWLGFKLKYLLYLFKKIPCNSLLRTRDYQPLVYLMCMKLSPDRVRKSTRLLCFSSSLPIQIIYKNLDAGWISWYCWIYPISGIPQNDRKLGNTIIYSSQSLNYWKNYWLPFLRNISEIF